MTSPNGWLHGEANRDDAKLGTYGYPVKDLMPWTNSSLTTAFDDKTQLVPEESRLGPTTSRRRAKV